MRRLRPEEGLALFDAALRAGTATIVPVALDLAILRGHVVPPVLHGLVPKVRRTAKISEEGLRSFVPQLGDLEPAAQQKELLGLVRELAASVLGHNTPQAIDPDVGFTEIGFDSLTVVELRNRLSYATGLDLPGDGPVRPPQPPRPERAPARPPEPGGDRPSGASPLGAGPLRTPGGNPGPPTGRGDHPDHPPPRAAGPPGRRRRRRVPGFPGLRQRRRTVPPDRLRALLTPRPKGGRRLTPAAPFAYAETRNPRDWTRNSRDWTRNSRVWNRNPRDWARNSRVPAPITSVPSLITRVPGLIMLVTAPITGAGSRKPGRGTCPPARL